MIRRTANGRTTAAEALGHREFSMTKLYDRLTGNSALQNNGRALALRPFS